MRGTHSLSQKIASYLIMLGASLFALSPLIWALLTSLKETNEILIFPPVWVPSRITLEHYRAVIFDSNVIRYMANTMLVAAVAILMILALGTHAAYAAARFRFRGRDTIMFVILFSSMVPLVSLLTPLYLVWARIDLYESYFGLALVFAAWQLPTTIWLIRGFIGAVPFEIEEAALIDGCSRWKCFYKIVLPIVQPGLTAAAIVVFIFIWNDFLVATTLSISEQHRMMQVGLYRYVGDLGVDWGRFTAYTILAIVPVVAIFVALQKRLISGLVAGSIKG